MAVRPKPTDARKTPPAHDIPASNRTKVCDLLNKSLAASLDLFTQVKQAHYTVVGATFVMLHELFDEMATELLEAGDDLAERIQALDGLASGTLRAAAATSPLADFPSGAEARDPEVCVAHLKGVYQAFATDVRQGIDRSGELGDQGTADLYTGIVRMVDKRVWYLDSLLRKS